MQRMTRWMGVLAILCIAFVPSQAATDDPEFDPWKCLGEYGCGHDLIHELGIVEKMRTLAREKTGKDPDCCDGIGECRLTKMRDGKVLIDGKMCPIFEMHEKKLVGVSNPWNLPVVCASRPNVNFKGCPAIHCLSAPPFF